MLFRYALLLIALGAAPAAQAWDVPASRLPAFASAPAPAAQSPAFWQFSPVVTGPIAFLQNMPGGNAGFAGYNHAFANKTFMSVTAGSGFTSSQFGDNRFAGYDFSSANVKFGYDMGRFRPFVTAGAVVANPRPFGGALGLANEPFNGLFNQNARAKSFVSAGAGFDIAVTNKITFGAGVYFSQGNGAATPFGAQGLR